MGRAARLARRARHIVGPPTWYANLRTSGVSVQRTDGTIPGEWIVPVGSTSSNVILYFHGGGYVSCSPSTHRPITAALARETRRRVLALDYRLAPEHRFPMAFNQAVAAIHWLLIHGTNANHVSSSELLLDDARRVHDGIQDAGGESTLRVFDGAPHGWQLLDGLMPEARNWLAEAASFIRQQFAAKAETTTSAGVPAGSRS